MVHKNSWQMSAFIALAIALAVTCVEMKDNFKSVINKRAHSVSVKDDTAAVYALINRTIGEYHDINDFIIVIQDANTNRYNLDNFVVFISSLLILFCSLNHFLSSFLVGLA